MRFSTFTPKCGLAGSKLIILHSLNAFPPLPTTLATAHFLTRGNEATKLVIFAV
jgi:hypothetical protein